MKLKDFDFRIWNGQENKFVSNAVLMSYVSILDFLGKSNTGVICGEYGFVENKNNENILTRFSRFFKRFLQKFQKTRITAPSDFGKNLSKNLTCELIPSLPQDELEIELFTGFYDKNGTKIYEGDVLRFNSNDINKSLVGVVIMSRQNFNAGCFVCKTQQGGEWIFNSINSFEVIGNIHENPELLESLEN